MIRVASETDYGLTLENNRFLDGKATFGKSSPPLVAAAEAFTAVKYEDDTAVLVARFF